MINVSYPIALCKHGQSNVRHCNGRAGIHAGAVPCHFTKKGPGSLRVSVLRYVVL